MIPAHNEESVISNTVETVLQMDYPNFWNLIAIDDRSTDNTASVIKDLEQKYLIKLSLIRPKMRFLGNPL